MSRYDGEPSRKLANPGALIMNYRRNVAHVLASACMSLLVAGFAAASHDDEIVILRADYFESADGRFLSVEARNRLGSSTPGGYAGPAMAVSFDSGPGTAIGSPPQAMNAIIDPGTSPGA